MKTPCMSTENSLSPKQIVPVDVVCGLEPKKKGKLLYLLNLVSIVADKF